MIDVLALSVVSLALGTLGVGCGSGCGASGSGASGPRAPGAETSPAEGRASPPSSGRAVAIFAGGCFWCMEKPFELLAGVESVVSGYAGGDVAQPSYEDVSSGRTGHAEAIRVVYDPSVVDYETLLEVFWRNVDPTDGGGQFCDRGSQYRTAIFPVDEAQRTAAEASIEATEAALGRAVATRVEEADGFWNAEDYHQDYYRTHPAHYERYRAGCGRDRRLRELWGAHGP